MGCSSTRILHMSEEEKELKCHENELGFFKFSCKALISAFSSNSNIPYLTESELQKGLKSLDLYNARTQFLFTNFANNNLYCAKKIYCLCVLLGYSQHSQKLSLLFKKYQSQNFEILFKSDIEMMVSHILFICLHVLPYYASIMSDHTLLIEHYCSKLSLFVNGMLKHFTNRIMSYRSEITFIEFFGCFEQKSVRILLSGKKLRRFVIKAFEKFAKNSDRIKYRLVVTEVVTKSDSDQSEIQFNPSISFRRELSHRSSLSIS